MSAASATSQALLPSLPLPVRSTSSTALAPSGRDAVALGADVIACPPAVVAALEADVLERPLPPPGKAPWRWRPTSLQALLPA